MLSQRFSLSFGLFFCERREAGGRWSGVEFIGGEGGNYTRIVGYIQRNIDLTNLYTKNCTI